MRRYEVTARLDRGASVQETSKLFEGLHLLDRSGRIQFAIEPRATSGTDAQTIRLSVRARTIQRSIAIDLADQRDLVDEEAIEEVEVYFKRSYCPSALTRLAHHARAKILPFGLNNPSVTLGASLRILTARVRTGRSAAEIAADARQLFALPSPQAFQEPPQSPAEPIVLYQVRLWPSDDSAVLAINEQRASLVRTLRKAFGARFVGGVIPEPFTIANHPDLLSRLPFSMRSYPEVVKRALVAVYTRGLHDSVAFKMSEYLAASRCIVADAVTAVLPEPLAENVHYLSFADPDQCATQCDQLLSRPSQAVEMRRCNWDYYRRQVEPGAHLLNTLNRAFE